MDKKIHDLWSMLPLFELLHSETEMDDMYVFKGFVFIFSLCILPLTFIPWLIGRMFK